MAHPNDGDPKKFRVLSAIETLMNSIKPENSYYHRVRQVYLYEGDNLVLGRDKPLIAIAPTTPFNVVGTASCAENTIEFEVALIGSVHAIPGNRDWKRDISWLMADIEAAIGRDIQLGGEVMSIEVVRTDIYDATSFKNTALGQVAARVSYTTAIDNPTI